MSLFGTMALLTAAMTASRWQNAKNEREINAIYRDVLQTNTQNRAVAVLKKNDVTQLLLTSGDKNENDVQIVRTTSVNPALDFIWGENDNLEGLIISGGTDSARINALMPFVRKSQLAKIPVLVLYTGNEELERMLINNSHTCEIVNGGDFYYDPFRGIGTRELANLLYESMPEGTSSPNAVPLFNALLDVILLKNMKLNFENVASFPLNRLMDELNTLQRNGSVFTEDYKRIEDSFMAGSSEIPKVNLFLSQLKQQAQEIFGKPSEKRCNIKKMFSRDKGIVAINVGINKDSLLNFVIKHLMYLQSTNLDFSMVLDNIPIAKAPNIDRLLYGRKYAICHQDLISTLFAGDRRGDDLLTEIAGNVSTLVLFHHSSGASRQKWSDQLGKYRKIRIQLNISKNKSFLNSSSTKGVNIDEIDEPRVRAEVLERLRGNFACIYNANGILFAEVLNA